MRRFHPLITGTLLLTAVGFFCRILGFFYRIFLSRTIGAEGLGLYQMIFPIHGIAFALCAGPIQTSLSRLTAASPEKGRAFLRVSLALSLSIALPLTSLIYTFADFLAARVLLAPECAPLLPALALSIPFCAIHACCCGYYYGLKKTAVPAFSQVVEQCIRIFSVLLIVHVCHTNRIPITVLLAVWGLLIGEAASAVFCLLVYGCSKSVAILPNANTPITPLLLPLLTMALPLMANRLTLSFLQSLEAIFVPNQLLLSGLSRVESVSIYGVLTGMALPFVLFPSAITNSLAVVLLPAVSEAQAQNQPDKIEHTISMALRYSLYMGILCVGLFTRFGPALGETFYHNADAGRFIQILSWLCPFLYLATSSGSILNGLGKTKLTFFHHLVSLLIRIAFVWFGIPEFGIRACLWGMLASEMLLALLHILALRRIVPCDWNAWILIGKPVFCLLCALWLFRLFPETLPLPAGLPDFFRTAVQILLLSTMYLLFLLFFHRKQSPAST